MKAAVSLSNVIWILGFGQDVEEFAAEHKSVRVVELFPTGNSYMLVRGNYKIRVQEYHEVKEGGYNDISSLFILPLIGIEDNFPAAVHNLSQGYVYDLLNFELDSFTRKGEYKQLK
jgi:hypothetical protein